MDKNTAPLYFLQSKGADSKTRIRVVFYLDRNGAMDFIMDGCLFF